jgi:hypothetical protein
MTPEEWERCDDPDAMLAFLRAQGGRPRRRRYRQRPAASQRRWRLFACACCRHLWHLLDERGKRAVETAERYADGAATEEELLASRRGAYAAYQAGGASDAAAYAAFEVAHRGVLTDEGRGTVWGYAVRAYEDLSWLHATWDEAAGASRYDGRTAGQERAGQCALLRDLFSPFWPGALDPAVLAWHDGAARRLAEAIYASRRFEDLPVLADLLEEAGCCNADLLGHLRGPGPHVLGCHALDAVLGKN